MTEYSTILVEDEGHLRTMTLNRPESLNAINHIMLDEMAEVFLDTEKDTNIRVLLITGSPRKDGRPHFSAGADLKQGGEGRSGESPAGEPLRHTVDAAFELSHLRTLQHTSKYSVVFGMLEEMMTPSIAVVDGICTTGGLELILSCDIRVVGEAAQISDWHIKNLGFVGGAGVTTRLPNLVGTARAKEILWTGTPVTGEEAVAIGLANHVYPSADLLAEAKKLASLIAEKVPASVGASKALVNSARFQTANEGVRYGNLWGAIIALQKEAGLIQLPQRPIR